VEVAFIGPGGDAIQIGAVGVRTLEDAATTDHHLGVGEITLPLHADGSPQHRRARHDEGFSVVSGTASFTVGAAAYEAPDSTLVIVAARLSAYHAPTLATSSPCCSTRSNRTPTCSASGTSATWSPQVSLGARSDSRGDGPPRHCPGHRVLTLSQPNTWLARNSRMRARRGTAVERQGGRT
jgi:hypothetical protein